MTAVLGRASMATGEDPFGPGDPVEVARLVRRALAATGRTAVEVTGLVLMADRAPSETALERFARRALGPHGHHTQVGAHLTTLPTHDARVAHAIAVAATRVQPTTRPGGDELMVAVVLGPDGQATALCLG